MIWGGSRRWQGAQEGASIRAKARLVAGLCLGAGDSQFLDCAQGVREGADKSLKHRSVWRMLIRANPPDERVRAYGVLSEG